jgi:hypothetical protein
MAMLPTPLSCDAVSEDDAAGAIRGLAEAVEPQLWALVEAARRVAPGIDGATIASLLITCGVEIGIGIGPVTRASMADYLRAMADALDMCASVLPSLTRSATEEEPPF